MNSVTGPLEDVDIINTLLAEASARGYVTYDQILEALPEVEDLLPLLETILEEFQAAGITIYESEDDIGVIEEPSEGLNGDAFIEEQAHAAPLFDLSNVPIDDSVADGAK